VPHGLRYARCGLPRAVTTHSWSDYWGFWRASSVVLGCAVSAVQGRRSVGGYHRRLTAELWWWWSKCYSGYPDGVMLFEKSREKYGKEKKKVHRRNDDNEGVVCRAIY
jgi:hypothetical protein